MKISLEREGSVSGLRDVLGKMTRDPEIQGVLILACEENGFLPEAIDELLREMTVPVFGGIFPQIIFEREKLHRGTIAAGMKIRPEVRQIPGLSDPGADFDGLLERALPEGGVSKTVLIFVDGYATRLSGLMEGVFNILGSMPRFIGGGAGAINPKALNLDQTPCLFSNQGLLKDHAQIVMLEAESGIGIGHGWHKLQGPFKITETRGNRIESIDWRPAFDVYREVIEAHSSSRIGPENFFEVAKTFPFGMHRLEAETIVRDPFAVTEKGAIIVATEVPRESFVDILTGDPPGLLKATRKARAEAMNGLPEGRPEKTMLLVDCVSRGLFLGAQFEEELDSAKEEGIPLIGFLSLGEIAGRGQEFLELHNKTAVIGVIRE